MTIPEAVQLATGAGPVVAGGVMFLVKRRFFDWMRSKLVLVAERDSAIVKVAQIEARLENAEEDANSWMRTATGYKERLRMLGEEVGP